MYTSTTVPGISIFCTLSNEASKLQQMVEGIFFLEACHTHESFIMANQQWVTLSFVKTKV